MYKVNFVTKGQVIHKEEQELCEMFPGEISLWLLRMGSLRNFCLNSKRYGKVIISLL